MSALLDVQENFLRMLIDDKATVNVFLVNRIRLSGQLAAFDRFAVVLESDSGSQLVFKHVISTVLPVNGRDLARGSGAAVSRDKRNNL